MILVDMEMPKSCEECYLKGEMDLCRALTEYYNADSIPKDCPIKAEIPNNATNGGVIKTLFPDAICIQEDTFVYIYKNKKKFELKVYLTKVSKKWWNAPYRAESEVSDANSD